MKKNIFAPDVRVIRFDSQDVIVTSIRDGRMGEDPSNDNSAQRGGFAPERTSIWD